MIVPHIEGLTMLAAVLHDYDRLELEAFPTPAPGPGQVLARIGACGFCAAGLIQSRTATQHRR